MKKLLIPIFLLSSQITNPADATTATQMIHTIDTYKLLETTAAHPNATTQYLVSFLESIGYDFGSTEKTNKKLFTTPDVVDAKNIKTAIELLYKLMVKHNKSTIKISLNLWMLPEKSLETINLYDLLTSLLSKASQQQKYEFVIFYFQDLNQIWNNRSIYAMAPMLKNMYQIKTFFTTLLNAYMQTIAREASKTFVITPVQRIGLISILQRIYQRENVTSIMTRKAYQPLLYFRTGSWQYNEFDIIYSLTKSAQELVPFLSCAHNGRNKDFFLKLFKKYLNKFCWVYRSSWKTYVAERKMGSKNTSKPPMGKDVKDIIDQEDFPWKSEKVKVRRYAASNKKQKVDTVEMTLQGWMKASYFK